MKKLMVFSTIAILSCGLVMQLCGAQERKPHDETTTEKTLSVQGVDRVKMDVFVGTIHVFADSPDAVHVKAVRSVEGGTATERQRWLKETRVDVEERNGTVQIKDIVPEELRSRPTANEGQRDFNPRLDLDLHVPRRLALAVTSLVGDVEADGQAGDLNIKSTAGNIHLKHLRCSGKSVDLRTSAGNIELEGQVGNLTVTDGAGKVQLDRLDCSGDRLELKTGAGNVNAAFLKLPVQRCNVEVGTGNIVVNLPARARATLDLTSSVGNVTFQNGNQGGVSSSRSRRNGNGPGSRASAEVNGGGVPVSIHVGAGNIRVESEGGVKNLGAIVNSVNGKLRATCGAGGEDLIPIADPPADRSEAEADDVADKAQAEAAAEKAEAEAEAAAEKAEAAEEKVADKAEVAAEAAAEKAEAQAVAAAEKAEAAAEKAEAAAEKAEAAAEKAEADAEKSADKAEADKAKVEAGDAADRAGSKGESADDLSMGVSGLGAEISRAIAEGLNGQDGLTSRHIQDIVQSAMSTALKETERALSEGMRSQQEADRALNEAQRALGNAPEQMKQARQAIERARQESQRALEAVRSALRQADRELQRSQPHNSEDQ